MKCKYTRYINSNDNAITASCCSNILSKFGDEMTFYKDTDNCVDKNFSLGDLGLTRCSPKRACGTILGTLLIECNQLCCILSVFRSTGDLGAQGAASPVSVMPLMPLTIYNKIWVINAGTS